MIIDNKGRLFGKINIIDLLVILVVIIAIAGIGYKFTRSKTPAPFVKTDTIEVEFFVEESPDFVVDMLKVGDPVKEAVQNTSVGKVTDIKRDKSIRWVETDKGEVIKATKEGHSSVIITIRANGFYGNNGVTINNVEYFVGRTLIMYVGNTALSGRISALRKLD